MLRSRHGSLCCSIFFLEDPRPTGFYSPSHRCVCGGGGGAGGVGGGEGGGGVGGGGGGLGVGGIPPNLNRDAVSRRGSLDQNSLQSGRRLLCKTR